MSGNSKRVILAVVVLIGLTPALAYWPYTIIRSFYCEYAPAAGPAVYHGGSTWRLVVIEECGYRYLHEGNGFSWDEVGGLFETPEYEVFAIDSDYGDFCALYRDGYMMMLYDGYYHYDTGVTWDINNYHDFSPVYNYPSCFAFESFDTLNLAEVGYTDVYIYAQWSGCDGDVSCVGWPELGLFIFGRFGDYYRCIEYGEVSTDYYIGEDSKAEGWVTEDGTVYIAYVNADHELRVITDTVSDEPVDEYVASSGYHPQLFADADGPVVATDTMVYYKNSMGDWFGEQYKSFDNMGCASCVFRQNGYIFVIVGKITSQYFWGMASFYNDWHSDTPVVGLQGQSTDEGVLVSWVEEAGLAGSSWTLEREGDELVTLSGEAEYRYLDRSLPGPGVYRYSLSVTPPGGDSFRVGPVEVCVEDDSLSRPVLAAPFPNPAEGVVALEYALPADCPGARLALYDLAGRRIDDYSLSSEPGDHAVEVDCSAYAPGVYTVVLEAAGETVTRRLVIAR